jgi:hypothetical protein
MDTTEELMRRVFFTGDPPENSRVTSKSNKGQFFPGCAKCHEVKQGENGRPPRIIPTNIADRWLTRGPFNHAPHGHMACVDCHDAALRSEKTSDILLPTRKLCAECHRPLEAGTPNPAVNHAETIKVDPALTARQRKEGGILPECQACHPKYHASGDGVAFAASAQKSVK